MRLQQFTGSVMAKGLEDTAFYRYCRLLSLNEVGGNPAKFGFSVEEFHQFNAARQSKWPLSLNASSTHDTKRGEDCRARLNVLSEIPQEFERHLKSWGEVNAKEKTCLNGKTAPDANEEYFVYQTLLAAFPFEEAEMQDFAQRLTAYLVKALREAKVNSSWLSPNLQYEEVVTRFVAAVLQNKRFLYDFLPFQQKIAHYGIYNSLAQTLLKITCPGIPDFYQGSELWNLSMVDPDNRRPVDFLLQQRLLAEVSASEPAKSQTFLEDFETGKAKLYVIFKALEARRRLKGLFEEGAYLPLRVEGELGKHLFAFARSKGAKFVVVVVPRFVVSLLESSLSWSKVGWKDTSITLPAEASADCVEMFTGARLHPNSGRLLVNEVLSDFPVALLAGGDSS
jgi:(1->4)-alpha-D-glucan 1-alpha-D-glucosylmutase